jgi:hypothetical protein
MCDSSMTTTQKLGKISQVKSGFRLAGLALLFFLVAGLFFASVDYLFFPGHSRALGLVFLVISTPVMVVTINRWVRVMTGILALAVLNGVLSISTGHLLANPAQPISRLDALYLTTFFAAAAALSSTMKARTLSVVDRISVLAFVFSFAYLLGYEGMRDIGKIAPLNATDFVLMGIGLSCLFLGWAYNRFKVQHKDADSKEMVSG